MYSVLRIRIYSIRITRTQEQTTPLLLHLFRRHGCLRTQRFSSQAVIIQRSSSSYHSFIFLLTTDFSCLRSGYLSPFCLPHTAPRFDIRPVTTFGSEKERENECTQTSTVGVSLQGCSHFVLDSVPCVVYNSVWVSSDCFVHAESIHTLIKAKSSLFRMHLGS